MALVFDGIQIGDIMPPYTSAPITRTHLVRYAGASGDFNPLHHDETFAKAVGLETVITHGMFIMGIAGQAITSWIDNRWLRKFSVHFLSMTQPVDLNDYSNTKDRATITVTGKVVDKYEENGETRIRCELTARDALGSRKLKGYFVAALP
ncbi:MAG: MaoC/PaaZ C-terminal domain-containing protein [Smithellaceae bacterium]|jgi:acyl dehydratase|nr:MaoC/PaaZ C-terminal domain-containing protein [Smithellaceae bacterium]MDD3259514.1 MaoC/PaaZ C-terminal domain-containing protein [Smithellaceae bacterium]MDD3849325.1 MaoC/PaaZ C-terminal domain-containing protein [Smithellaceae bacterium]HOG11693.1 MaoC/PaaZ C-terminal domain-containing protein [Smithellaceae bacterium]HOQ71633.1 MaoC/PaaZ C-terminal domain-containing protein [Smithellaceae bacterium]